MSREVIETSPFFARMEEFGFFDAVEEHLPPEFTMIYEIARIIEDETSAIGKALAPILALDDHTDKENALEPVLVPNIPDAKEYEADLIRSVSEIRNIYPYQFLLPENVFLQRVAERSLWMPRPRVPRNFRYQTESETFSPDDRKQKVYVLFDTSSSMRQHYRIHLARAITYLFLKQNQQELGTVFFRTFDLEIGDLWTARDLPSFTELISHMMHERALGNGTSLQKALEHAIDDISHESQLSQAQILVITDGVAHIDLEKLQEQMGDQIIVNTVKIGHARMIVDAKIIEDQVYQSSSDDAIRLRSLLEQKHDAEVALKSAAGHLRTESLKSQLGLLQRQIDTLMSKLSEKVEEQYGLEIQRLSSTYVEIDDIPADEMFSFPETKVKELVTLAESLLDVLEQEHQVEDIKRAAILYDHLYLLMEYNEVDAPRLERAAKELENMLEHILNKPDDTASDISISDTERMQLANMLEGGLGSQKFSLGRILRMFWMKLKRWWRTRRQARMFTALTGKRLKGR